MKHMRMLYLLLSAAMLLTVVSVLSACTGGGSGDETESTHPAELTGEEPTQAATEGGTAADTAEAETDAPAPVDETDAKAVIYRTAGAIDWTQYLNPANIQRALGGTDAVAVGLNGVKAWVGGGYKDASGALTRKNGELVVSGEVLSALTGKTVTDGTPDEAAAALGMQAEVFDKKLVLFWSGDKAPLSAFDDCYTMEALWLELCDASAEEKLNALITLPALVSNGQNAASYYTSPDISLAVQTNVYYAALGDNDKAATGPAPVVGEGAADVNHTLVRVFNRQQICTAQFLAFDPSVTGGVQVAAVGTTDGVLIACAAYNESVKDIRIFDENGTKRTVLTPDSRIAAPYAVLSGHFLSDTGSEVLLVTSRKPDADGHLTAALYDAASGKQLKLFELNVPFAKDSTVQLSRRTGTGCDGVILFFRGVNEAYEGDCESLSFKWTGIQLPENATGVFASANEDETYLVTVSETEKDADKSFIRVYGKQDSVWGVLTDVGRKENIMYNSLAADNDYGYVDNLSFQHIRADIGNAARANLNSQGTVNSFDDLYLSLGYADYAFDGMDGYLKLYYTGHNLFEPCFTHRWNGGCFNNFVAYKDADGNHIYAAIGKSGNYENYIELGSSFDNGTYADGLMVLAKIRTFPIRSFTRALAGVYRGPDGNPAMLIGMSPVHEQEINVSGSVGDYNVYMIRGFAAHLLEVYGSVENVNKRFGTDFATAADIDAPRDSGRGAWDAYKGDYFVQWSLYTRNIINKRIMEAYREALLAGFPPETITSHQIPEGDAVSGFLGEADTRLSPCDTVMSSGTAFGATRYGYFSNDRTNFLSIAHKSGHNAVEFGEYCALTESEQTAYQQLSYLWKNGVRAISYITFNDAQTRAEQAAALKLQAENKPRPGYTGGSASALGIRQAGRTYEIVQIGEGEAKQGLLKSVTADGSFEGTVYVVPFRSHVNVTTVTMTQDGLTYTSDGMAGLQNGDQAEFTFDAVYTGTGSASVRVEVYEAGILQERAVAVFAVGDTLGSYRYVLSNQISPEELKVVITFTADETDKLTVTGMTAALETECVGRKYFVGGKEAYKASEAHTGGVTFDVLTRDMVG